MAQFDIATREVEIDSNNLLRRLFGLKEICQRTTLSDLMTSGSQIELLFSTLQEIETKFGERLYEPNLRSTYTFRALGFAYRPSKSFEGYNTTTGGYDEEYYTHDRCGEDGHIIATFGPFLRHIPLVSTYTPPRYEPPMLIRGLKYDRYYGYHPSVEKILELPIDPRKIIVDYNGRTKEFLPIRLSVKEFRSNFNGRELEYDWFHLKNSSISLAEYLNEVKIGMLALAERHLPKDYETTIRSIDVDKSIQEIISLFQNPQQQLSTQRTPPVSLAHETTKQR